MEFLFANSPMVWVVFGIILVFSEFLIPGTFVLFLGLGAILTGILSRLFAFSFQTELGVWACFSLCSILLGSALVKKFFRSESSVDPFTVEDYLGQIVPVEVDVLVERHGGKVRFQGTVWDAISKSEKIPKGSYVRIVKRENLTFTVERVES